MTAVPVMSRRSVGCISDLTIDRWLLGETPGSDEARRVEEHVKRCAPCASRLRALRGLYSTQVPAARHEPPVPLDAVPAQAPGMSGALQFVILRDGLLVGTEFFTPGTYVIGSDGHADLQLDGVLPRHVRVYFRDGRVALKAEAGPLYVNGFKVDSCEVRAIDEVLVGPYVLRCRVLRERWSDVDVDARRAPTGEVPEETITVRTELPEATVIEPAPAPAVTRTRLTAELWWGDTQQQVRSVEQPLAARDFPLWGFTVPGDDFVLAEPGEQGAWVVHPPPGAGAERTLKSGERAEFRAGVMRLVLRVDPVLARLPAAPLVSWPTVGLAGLLLAAFFTTMALAPEPEEERFTPHDFKREVTLIFPKPAPKPTPAPVVDRTPSSRRQDPEVKAPVKRPSTPAPPRPMDRFSALNKVLKGGAVRSIFDATKGRPAGKPNAGRGKPGLLADLGGLGAGGTKGLDFGIKGDGGAGIGAGGATKGGAMTGGGFGTGPIGGRVLRPVATGITTPPGTTSSIDKDAVAKAIAAHLAEISSCYERSLITNGHSGGRLALEWTITTSGLVAQAKVKSSTLGDATVASCVMARLKTWQFPKARGGSVVVSYPFVFQSSDYR